MVHFLTLLSAKCNLDKICVYKVFALVREDPEDRLDIHICFLKEDRNTRRNLQGEDYQGTLKVVHFSQQNSQNTNISLFPLRAGKYPIV